MSSQTFDAETVDAIFNERDQLKAENAKLVDVLHEVETEAVYAYHCLQQDCMTTADSSEHFFKKWWHAECELDRLKTENAILRDELEMVGTAAYLYGRDDLKADNAKLRELVKAMTPFLCCMPFASCNTLAASVRKRMSELGIEVDG